MPAAGAHDPCIRTGIHDRSPRTAAGEAAPERAEAFREATVMVLYVCVVEIAELAALPEQHFAHGVVTGPVGWKLLAVIWGTAIGLALAHVFAFQLAAPAFRNEHASRHDVLLGLAQLAGALAVATLSSLPVLFLPDVRAQETVGYVPAVLIGAIGYVVARRVRQSRWTSAFYGVTALALGVLIAVVKTILSAH